MKDFVFSQKITRHEQCDLCVIGGSCTGVFAAIRAARLGAKVILIEKANRPGGVATLGLVGMWHSLFDFTGKKQIIGGLTQETLERLERQQAVTKFRVHVPEGIRFNPENLTLILDRMIMEERDIRLHLHTQYLAPVMASSDTIRSIIAGDKSGLFSITATCFLDASGDGLLCRDAGVAMHRHEHPQPPTACCRFEGWHRLTNCNLKELIEKNRNDFPDLPCGYHWGCDLPGSEIFMLAGTRVLHCDCSDAESLTRAELISRRQIQALTDLLRREYPDAGLSLQALPSMIGIRDGLHITSMQPLSGKELLTPSPAENRIANGTYPVDIHHDNDDSIEFYHLDGGHRIYHSNNLVSTERWLPEGEILPYYQIPLHCMIPAGIRNLIAAGRMIDADPTAFGAVRVMVNLNQCGEAAGIAAFQYLRKSGTIQDTDSAETRRLLAAGGSIIL